MEGDRCASLPLPTGAAPAKAPMAVLMGELSVTATGGLFVANGTMGASDAMAAVPGDGLAVLDGAWFLGSLGVRVDGAGVASLANVVALDCSLCKAVDAIASLPWADLPAGPKANRQSSDCHPQ